MKAKKEEPGHLELIQRIIEIVAALVVIYAAYKVFSLGLKF